MENMKDEIKKCLDKIEADINERKPADERNIFRLFEIIPGNEEFYYEELDKRQPRVREVIKNIAEIQQKNIEKAKKRQLEMMKQRSEELSVQRKIMEDKIWIVENAEIYEQALGHEHKREQEQQEKLRTQMKVMKKEDK